VVRPAVGQDPQVYFDGYVSAQGASAPLVRLKGLLEPAVAENLPVRAGKAQHLREHLQRLAEGVHALAWPAPDLKAIAAVCRRLPLRNRLKRGSLRLRYWGGLPEPLLLAQTFQPRPQPAQLRLMTSVVRHYGPESLNARAKVAQMLPNLLAKAEVQAWAEDGLRLTPDGLVAEGVWSNVVALKRGVVRTPPLYAGVLEGVTRGQLLAGLRRKGYAVREEPLQRYDLWTADAVWVCSSLAGALPVSEVDGRVVGGPGIQRRAV
jgi:branched-chain amino acid aminotransferase